MDWGPRGWLTGVPICILGSTAAYWLKVDPAQNLKMLYKTILKLLEARLPPQDHAQRASFDLTLGTCAAYLLHV